MATNWLPCEQLQLCISYCRHSTDSIIGNSQKKGQLWSKIASDYHENWDGVRRAEPRSQIALSSHFGKLKKDLKLWGASLAQAQRTSESGGNLQDEVINSIFL